MTRAIGMLGETSRLKASTVDVSPLQCALIMAHPVSFVFSIDLCSSSTVNAVLEAGRKSKSPVIIQVSNGGGAFYAGKVLKDKSDTIGSVALAMHVRSVAKYYGIPVIIHSDHCAKKVRFVARFTWNVFDSDHSQLFLCGVS